jgi:hypothetical protein
MSLLICRSLEGHVGRHATLGLVTLQSDPLRSRLRPQSDTFTFRFSPSVILASFMMHGDSWYSGLHQVLGPSRGIYFNPVALSWKATRTGYFELNLQQAFGMHA